MDGLGDVVTELSADPEVKALIISGAGRGFCAGADLDYLHDILEDNARYFDFVQRFNRLFLLIEDAPIPVIAMVHDLALAGGLELLLACDFAVAAEDARIGDQHGTYGLMPGGGSTQRLPRRIGLLRAKEMLFAADWISGARAAEIGLVLSAVPRDDLEACTWALARRFVDKSRRCTALTKRAVQRGLHLPMREALQQEAHAVSEYFTSSPSQMIGLEAFRRGQKPEFPE
ncbi:enoyl-CoA hydratase/isomerase family protein [Nocardioides sp. AN3]